MGGQSFFNIGIGKTPNEAFNHLSEEARYQHGHGGYTGTIAEKPGFQLLSTPPGVAALDMAKWVASYVPREYRDEPWNKNWKKEYPDTLESQIRRSHEIWSDKWGPALAYEIKGEELEAFKKLKDWRVPESVKTMPPGSRVFVFLGMASS